MSQYLNHQTTVPSSSVYRGVSPVIFVDASDVSDGHDTSGRSARLPQASPDDMALELVSPSSDTPVRHYILEIFFFGLFCSTIPIHFMAFEHFARSARLASLSAATPTFLSKWYTLWASVFLGIGLAGCLLLCDFMRDLSTALARSDKKWYRHKFSLFDPNIVTTGEDLTITGKGIVLWKIWAITLEGLLSFCTQKEFTVSWRIGCQCQSFIGAVLWACGIMKYVSFAVILFFIWVILILNFISEIISPISSDHTRSRQVVEACSLIVSIMITVTTIS